MRGFKVFLIESVLKDGGEAHTKTYLDTVFDNERNPVAVKRQLVARGEFPPNIYVTRQKRSASQ